MFTHLRLKLTVLYASLFAAILLALGLAGFAAMSDNAQRQVRSELATSATVFERVWALRTAQLENGAELLAGDFGFRSAIATGDLTTVRSALDNLRRRQGVDLALLVGLDGKVTAAGGASVSGLNPQTIADLEGDEATSGLIVLGDVPYQVVSVPARAPTAIGWVVFASRLDRGQMSSLERLAAISLNASVLHRTGHEPWRDGAAKLPASEAGRIASFIDQSIKSRAFEPRTLTLAGKDSMVVVRPLHSIDPGASTVLLLQYPLERAMAPFRLLLGMFILIGLVGLVVLLAGSWALARTVTRPVSALEDAARRLQRGEQVEVAVETRDEIGRLAASFNHMAADISRRERELDATKTFLDAVVENLPAMVVVKDLQHRLVLLNRAGEELLGVGRAAVIGKTDHDLFPKAQADFFVERDTAVLESGRLELIPEEPIQTAQGERFLQTKKIAIPDADGRPQYLLAISEDITERKAAAEALRLAHAQAEAANRAKSSFLANMSHEVRTPLNGVLGVAGVLSSTRLDGRQREMVGIIENSAAVLQRVLNDVLELARVEAGRMQIVEETFSLADAIDAVARSTAMPCRAKGLEFNVISSLPERAFVAGDRVRLEQVLGNLLSNAVKFTSAGEVHLTVEPANAEATAYRFEVRDTGIGFDPAQVETLFKPFQQADNSDTRTFGGTGLGLSISRELARAMGGELSARGAPDKGAVFTLTLPLKAGSAPVEAEPITRDVPAPATARTDRSEAALRVLLADDHETNRKVVRLILSTIGADLACVEDGAEAVAAFKAGDFDVVLMDLQMPVMDGLTAIRMIRAHEAETGATPTPIVVLSANAMPEHLAGSKAAGADNHIAKPVTAPVLIGALQAALDAAPTPTDSKQAGGVHA